MPSYRLNCLRYPDELRFALSSILSHVVPRARELADNRSIELQGLNDEQRVARSLFAVVSEVDGVVSNLNIVLSDLEQLSDTARAFGDRDPFKRFQFLVRMYFYEYGRFEDLFAYFTRWKQHCALLTKDQRKEQRDAFHNVFEDPIRMRNTMLHDGVSWAEQCSPEIALLQGLEVFGYAAKDKDGNWLSWETHLGPLCNRTLLSLLDLGQHMVSFWNVELADSVEALVNAGRMRRAVKPYVGPQAELVLQAQLRHERKQRRFW